ncbi:receptor-type tyrosine-protein phosphatase epsilon-like isoform X2 [Crassostrea angulata]|uniref:receptor-type tyrosine-protein phosphatase epsilon-like isoform X2 n=1 Tax=Magallana angulata TaxID=2784310 RepID=UPI0022B14EDC|nr:receptor-type tyrosine-protein phosphatase epsilon-like isoform X2 [Crassostrea angulata]
MLINTLWINWTFLNFIVIKGYDDLSANKVAHQYKTSSSCAGCEANKAVDRDIQTCTRMEEIGPTSLDKSTWWHVDLGGTYNVYNIRIQFKNYDGYTMRQRGRFAGFSLYVSNTTDRHMGHLCYKDGPELPPLDFNTNCLTHGRYVIFYNERLPGKIYPMGYKNTNVFTELCEVIVTGCSSSGVYGENCDKVCPGTCQYRRCDIINGTCLGCSPGWLGARCDKACSVGYYGLQCESKCVGHCKDGVGCNHTSGLCDKGCDDGWTGSNCNKGCVTGMFGKGCSEKCSGHCLDNVSCNSTNGHCDGGCDLGYVEPFCNRSCEMEKNSKGCSVKCSGHCLDNVSCNSTTGHCDGGCALGYVEPFCNKYLESQTADLHLEVTIGAVGAGVFLLIFVVIILYVLRQRRNKSKKADGREETMGFSAMDEILIKSRKKPAVKTGIKNDVLKSDTKEGKERLLSKDSQNLNGLTKYLSEINNTKMEEEYKAIPKGELHSCIEGKRQENKSKNRYTTIFPYDHSRVVLSSPTTGSDYINANYIADVFGKKKYIATQGPKESTIADFWRMIWQENARIIVCLTNISEAKTKKCAKYWPDLNDKHMEGDISVRCQKEQTYAENVVRHLRTKSNLDKTERDVFMFHYTQWPDHGVPEPLSLVVFHRHVMKTVEDHPMGYIVVHCSAGIGRTGTFIALDALYKEGGKTDKVNVPQYVEKMRNARMNMIQGEDQYKTVYMALLEAFRGRLRAVPLDFFLKEFQDHSCYLNHGDVSKQSPFALEFEELLSFRKVYTHEDYKSGMSNIVANYVPSVLPVERYLCPLTTENLYYNAVCLQSFKQCDRFISAQFPLPDYTEHFLNLVKTNYTCTIVSLYPLGEVKSTSLWLPTKNQQKTVGPFTIKLAESTQAKYVAKTNITIQQKGGSSMRVAVLECRGWEDEYDGKSRRILIDLVQEAKIEERTHPTGRILVLSSDGAKRCGPFCAVFNALEQMMMDEEVDLFTITRQLQTRRPEFLSSLEEYQFCFDTISDYLQNDTLYANV